MPKNNFKVVMLGAQLAGKTSLIEQCIYGVYQDGMVNIPCLIHHVHAK